MDLEAIVEEALSAAIDLIEITSYETELLGEMRPTELEPLMQQKQEVAHFYHNLLQKLQRRKASFVDLSEHRRNEIIEVNDWLRLIVGENARMLRAAFEASERFLYSVKRAVQSVRGQDTPIYSKGGKMRAPAKSDAAIRSTLGYNELS